MDDTTNQPAPAVTPEPSPDLTSEPTPMMPAPAETSTSAKFAGAAALVGLIVLGSAIIAPDSFTNLIAGADAAKATPQISAAAAPQEPGVVVAGGNAAIDQYVFTTRKNAYTVSKLIVLVPTNIATSISAVTISYKDQNGLTKTSTQVPTFSPNTQPYAAATFTGLEFYLAKGAASTLQVSLSVPTIASGATSGIVLSTALSPSGFEAIGPNGGTVSTFGSSTLLPGTGKRIVRKSIPNVTVQDLNSPTVGAGPHFSFVVTANPAGDIDLYQFSFLLQSQGLTIASTTLYDVTGGGVKILAAAPSNANGIVTLRPAKPITIAAGASRTYELRSSIKVASSTAALQTSFAQSKSGYVTNSTAAAIAAQTTALVWSDWSDPDHAASATGSATTDWTNDYLVQSLGASTLLGGTLR